MEFTEESAKQARKAFVEVGRKMAEHTATDCKHICKSSPMGSCCDSTYCDMASQFARETWGVELQPVEGWEQSKRLPFIGEQGCIVEPHLRPLCTVHHCDINGLGFKKGDLKWTERYFELRGEFDDLLMQIEMIDGV